MLLAAELVQRNAQRFPARTAVVFEGRSLTYREVDEAANRFAGVLAGRGLRKGDRVALLAGNELWSIPLDFACLKAGLVRVALNPRLSLREHRQMLAETGARLTVHTPELGERADQLRVDLPELAMVGLGVRGADGGPDLLREAAELRPDPPEVALAPSDPVLLLDTSGTTGTSRAVTHTQGSYGAIAVNILANLLSPTRDSVMLHAASLIHASGTFVLPYWLRGGTAAVLRSFEPATSPNSPVGRILRRALREPLWARDPAREPWS